MHNMNSSKKYYFGYLYFNNIKMVISIIKIMLWNLEENNTCCVIIVVEKHPVRNNYFSIVNSVKIYIYIKLESIIDHYRNRK